MKRLILLFIIIGSQAIQVVAQKAPKWMDKSKKAIITVTTFDKDNRKINATSGFYVSETGEALSAYSLFNGAYTATVTDTDGNFFPVVSIIGADDLYDVIKFKVAVPKKVAFLPMASDPIAEGTPVYLLPYAPNDPFKEGSITEASKLKDPYSYYKISFPLEAAFVNSPLLLSTGQVFALAQEDASGKKQFSYGVSASYVNSLNVSTIDAFNPIYTKIGIRKAWASDIGQATVSLFLLAGSQDAKTYLETLNDFISTFPKAPDGYQSRATHYATKRDALASTPAEQQNYLDLALADLNTAAKLNPQKGDALYNQAKLIYQVVANDSTLTDKNWTVEAAKAALQKAIQTEDLPIYRTLEGEIDFNEGAFAEAYDAFTKVNNSNMASSNSFYMAYKALENIPGTQLSEIIALLDSSIARMGTPTPKDAAPYILERIEHKTQLSLFKEAIDDYDLYYDLVDGRVNDGFYFYREQAKFKAGDNKGALQDIKEALKINDQIPDYHAEEAAIQVRMQNYTEALVSIQKALDLAPDFGACYRLRGICCVRQEKKTEACEAFTKAQELGDPLAARLIKEHCQ